MSYKGQLNTKCHSIATKKKNHTIIVLGILWDTWPVLPPKCQSYGKQGKTEKLLQSKGTWRDVMAKCSMIPWVGSKNINDKSSGVQIKLGV